MRWILRAATMRICEFARRTGTRVETIRYYEKEGMLTEPMRSDGNYRVYRSEHLEALQFTHYCRNGDASEPGCLRCAPRCDTRVAPACATVRPATCGGQPGFRVTW